MVRAPKSALAKNMQEHFFFCWSLIQSKSWASSAYFQILSWDFTCPPARLPPPPRKNRDGKRKESWSAAGSAHCRVCGPPGFHFIETHRQPIPWWQLSALSNPTQDFLLSESVRIAPVNTVHMPSSCCAHSATEDQWQEKYYFLLKPFNLQAVEFSKARTWYESLHSSSSTPPPRNFVFIKKWDFCHCGMLMSLSLALEQSAFCRTAGQSVASKEISFTGRATSMQRPPFGLAEPSLCKNNIVYSRTVSWSQQLPGGRQRRICFEPASRKVVIGQQNKLKTGPVTITTMTLYPKNELSCPLGNTCGMLFLKRFHPRGEKRLFVWVSNDPKAHFPSNTLLQEHKESWNWSKGRVAL